MTYDERDEREVQRHEDEIALPFQIIQQRRRDHDDEEIPDPVRADADGGAFCAHVQGEDLRDVDPGDAVCGHAEDEHVGEEKGLECRENKVS